MGNSIAVLQLVRKDLCLAFNASEIDVGDSVEVEVVAICVPQEISDCEVGTIGPRLCHLKQNYLH